MDILKAFSLFDENHHINIQGTLEEPLFQANQIGKLLDLRNIRENLRDFNEKDKIVSLSDTLGGRQDTVFLTEYGLYKLLGRSRKPIASVFQNWIVDVLKEIRITGMYQLQKHREVDRKLLENNCKQSHHLTLLKAFDLRNVVYILKLKDVNETDYIIKIGSTQNIKQRVLNIARTFDTSESLLLDIFHCNQHTRFENFIRNHSFVSRFNYPTLKKDNTESRETYLVNDEQYNEIIKIINENKSNDEIVNNIEIEEIRLKYEQLRNDTEEKIIKQRELDCKLEELKLEYQKIENEKIQIENEKNRIENEKMLFLENNNCITKDEIDNENEDEYENVVFSSIRKRNHDDRIPRVYKYDPNDLTTPIKAYDCPSEAEREESISQSALKLSVKNNTIYKGHRWYICGRTEESPVHLPPTVENRCRPTDIHYIAMIDIKKTKIIQVFSTQKEASKVRNMKTNGFSRAIKEGTLSSGHYWNYFDNCPEEMKAEYLKNNRLPEKFNPPIGKKVNQIDPKTGQVVKTYPAKREILKWFQMSNTTLTKIIETGEIYKGYKWETVQ